VAAVSTSPDRVRVVADALLAGGDKLGLAPFTAPGDKLDPKLAAQVDETVESIAQAVVPGVVALERHPAVDMRTRAVELLARRPEPRARSSMRSGIPTRGCAARGSLHRPRPEVSQRDDGPERGVHRGRVGKQLGQVVVESPHGRPHLQLPGMTTTAGLAPVIAVERIFRRGFRLGRLLRRG
jgi:hypothetical protein